LIYSLFLAPLGVVPAFTGLGGVVYLFASAALGVWFAYEAFRVFKSRAGDEGEAAEADLVKAKSLFKVSLIYLSVLFAVIAVEHGLNLYISPSILWGGI
jgi:protoheme IX farnesyltransferase